MLDSKKKANAKWNKANYDRTTLTIYKDGRDGFTLHQLRLVAEARGLSVNKFILEAIKKEMWK